MYEGNEQFLVGLAVAPNVDRVSAGSLSRAVVVIEDDDGGLQCQWCGQH